MYSYVAKYDYNDLTGLAGGEICTVMHIMLNHAGGVHDFDDNNGYVTCMLLLEVLLRIMEKSSYL